MPKTIGGRRESVGTIPSSLRCSLIVVETEWIPVELRGPQRWNSGEPSALP